MVTPHATVRWQQGTVSLNGFPATEAPVPATFTIDTFRSTNLGLDVLYEPFAITLSGMLDLAADEGETRTSVFTLSYAF